jgi:hypothetical protein
MEKKIIEQGKCPKCDNEILDYGDLESQGEMIFYEVTCPNCDFSGKEWYNTTFTCFTDSDNDDEEVK